MTELQRHCIEQVKRNIVDCIYSSARIEGIAVTFPETQQLYDGMNVARLSVSDVVKINNLKHAWEFVFASFEYPLDLLYLRQLNQIINAGLMSDAGQIRSYDVQIGGTSWKPELPDLATLQSDLFQIMEIPNALDRAISLMLYVTRAQIFSDGNKRVAQLAANQILIQAGRGYLKLPVDRMDEFYEKLVAFYESNDGSDIAKFIRETSVYETQTVREMTLPPVSEEMFLNPNAAEMEADWGP